MRIEGLIAEESIQRDTWRLLDIELARPANPIAARLALYMHKAGLCFAEGRFEKSREYYQKALLAGESLYLQAENYVRSCRQQESRLKEYARQAKIFYRDGDFASAKMTWEKIAGEAKTQPLALEIS